MSIYKNHIENMPVCSLVAMETDHDLCISWFLDVKIALFLHISRRKLKKSFFRTSGNVMLMNIFRKLKQLSLEKRIYYFPNSIFSNTILKTDFF